MKKINNENNEVKQIKSCKEKGSITIFVLLTMIFFVIILSSVYIASINKQKSTLKNVEEIAENYEVEESEYEGIYAKLENMAASGEITQEQYDALLNEVQNNNEALVAKISELETTINNLYPVGSIYITSTRTDPGTYLGGTWTLKNRSLAYASWYETSYETGNVFTPNTSNISSYTFSAIRNINSIEFNFSFKNKVNLSDTAVEIGTIDFSKLGIKKMYNSPRMVGFSDGDNGVFYMNIDYSTGVVTILDTLIRGATASTLEPSDYVKYSQITCIIPASDSYMIDSACNEFVWQRTK